MKNNAFVLAAAAMLGVAAAVHLSTPAIAGENPKPELSAAQKAVSPDAAISAAAIKTLRARGPAGLQALLDTHADLIRRHMNPADGKVSAGDPAAWNRLRAALDAVSGQRDCEASHLYWFTDLDQAKAAAKSANKPILSLRLLGKLDEEYSCANSRFFRTTLYANTEVSQYLRDHFILHWKSVRPVPRITIDFGDGRKIDRTITGNSIHYILDSNGEVIDALPGLYGPKAFLEGLNYAERAATNCAALSGDERAVALRQYHNEHIAATAAAWQADLVKLAASPIPVAQPRFATPTAFAAGRPSASKGLVENPMLQSFQQTDDATWTRIAALHTEDAALDDSSRRLIQAKYPTARQAGVLAMSKSRAEDPLSAMLNNLQRSIAEDTVRNEYKLHFTLHQWFVSGTIPRDLDRLNSKVYADLFLTPDTDPWLGLVPQNTFTALDENGLIQASKTR